MGSAISFSFEPPVSSTAGLVVSGDAPMSPLMVSMPDPVGFFIGSSIDSSIAVELSDPSLLSPRGLLHRIVH